MVRRGLVEDLEQARHGIAAGLVTVGGAPATNASRLVAADESLSVASPRSRFVSRGGDKLAAALERFNLDLTGSRVLDAGASTGGFTDCALQAGASVVVAVDVGRGQLHHRLVTDERVQVRERTNVRHLAPGDLGDPFDAIVADLSFISLTKVAGALIGLARPGADLIWLVKPQFEAERSQVTLGSGVISDPQVWRSVLNEVGAAIEGHGATIMELMASPLRGADGNVEFVLHGHAPDPSSGSGATGAGGGIARLSQMVDRVVSEVTSS